MKLEATPVLKKSVFSFSCHNDEFKKKSRNEIGEILKDIFKKKCILSCFCRLQTWGRKMVTL